MAEEAGIWIFLISFFLMVLGALIYFSTRFKFGLYLLSIGLVLFILLLVVGSIIDSKKPKTSREKSRSKTQGYERTTSQKVQRNKQLNFDAQKELTEALGLFSRKEAKKAISKVNKILSLPSLSEEGIMMTKGLLARCYAQLKEYEQALKLMDEVMNNPYYVNSIEDYVMKGKILIDLGLEIEAEMLLGEALKKFPDNSNLIILTQGEKAEVEIELITIAAISTKGPVYFLFDTKKTIVDLSSKDLVQIFLSPIQKITNLQELSLEKNRLTDIDLSPLTHCKYLEVLNLNYNQLGSIDITPLHECNLLETLVLNAQSPIQEMRTSGPNGLKVHRSSQMYDLGIFT
ncbi:MAG: leucine-rich repeat domain-containing protein, partial [Candidatus Kariarchaeaceae archaeon]